MMRTVVKVDDYKNLDERFANVVVQYTEILMSTASSATRRRRNSDLEEDLTCEVVEVRLVNTIHTHVPYIHLYVQH